MKKTLIAIAALAAALVGCNQFGEDQIVSNDGIVGETFYGTIDEDTRTTIDSQNKTYWEEDDLVSVFEYTDHNLKYQVTPSEDKRTAELNYIKQYVQGTGAQLEHFYAVFPYNDANTISGSVLSFPMPATVTGAADNTDHYPMVSMSDTHGFGFKSPAAIMRIKVSKEDNPNTFVLNSITIKSRKGQKLAGTANVDMSAETWSAVIVDDENASSSITLNLGEGLTLTTENQFVYFALPPMTFEANDLSIEYSATISNRDQVTGVVDKAPSIAFGVGQLKQTSLVVVSDPFSGSTPDADPVANVNGVEYTTLEAAFKAAIDLGSEQTISVVADASVKEAITVPASSKINLILNGNNVTSELTGVTITNNGTLNVMGGTITTNTHGIKLNATGASLTVGAGATLVSKEGAAAYAPADVDAVITILGNVESQGVYGAIQTNGTSGTTIITIEEGAKVTAANSCALYCPGANITINGGEITGSTAIYHKKGSLVINGGTFTATGAYSAYSFNPSGSNTTGDAVVVEACEEGSAYTPCSIEIYGGTFVATDTANGARALAFYEQPGVTVDPVESTIIAGTYNTDPNEYVTRGYKATQNAEGLWVVGENFEATIGSTKYVTVAEAFAAAQKGNTITLLKDATLTESIVVTDNNVLSDITLDGAGKTVTLNMTSGTGFQFGKNSNGVTAWATGVKIKDLTIKGTATYALYLCGGTSSVIDNLTVEGTYDNGGYGAVILYGTHGATIRNSNICSGFSNGSDVYPLKLENTKWGELFINASEIDATAKLFIDDQSSVVKVICGSYKSNMVDYDSIERIGTLKAEIEKKGSTTYGEYDMVAELGKVLYASVADAAAETTDTNNTVVLYNGEHNLDGVSFPVADIKFVGEKREQTVIKLEKSLYWTGKSVSFENLTYSAVKNAPYNEHHMWIHHANNINFEKCNIERLRLNVSASLINDCVLSTDVASGFDGYPVYYSGNNGSNHKLTNSKINGVSKGAVIYNEGKPVINLTVENCQFTATNTDSTKAAIQMHSELGISGTLVVNNSTATGFANINGGLWNEVKNNVNPAVENFNFTKIIDGRTYVAQGLWLNNTTGEYEIDNAAGLKSFATIVNAQLNDIFDGATVNLMNDIDLGGEEWIPIGDYRNSSGTQFGSATKPSKFNGNRHTIKNFKVTQKTAKGDSNKSSYGLFANVHADIENLTVQDAVVDLSNATSCGYVGALVGRLNGGSLTNCHVVNATVAASFWQAGALVGQMNSNGKISGCSVTTANIAAQSAVGSLVGIICNGGENVIENSEATNVNITMLDNSYGDNYKRMFGALVGALYNGARTTYLNNCEFDNVTVKGQASNIAVGSYEEGDIVYIDGYQFITDGVMIADLGQGAYEISNANGLVWFGTEVNVNNNRFSGKTVKLLNDITLDKAWEPVGQTGATQFHGIFDGQNKTITGLTINAPESYSENYSTGLFGWVETGAVIKNVKLDGAIINGYHYVGAIAGFMSGSAKIQDCEVINSTIVADPTKRDTSNGFNGDKIGGIVGMIYGGNTVSGNTVSETTIKGYRHIGGIIGYSYGTATNNTVGSGVVINVDNSNNYKSYKVQADYGVNHIAGVVGSGANVDNTNTGVATINWGAISENNPGVTINPGQGDDIDW